jgi:hypothetical protein
MIADDMKANGGLIGPFPLSDLSDSLKQMVQTMKPGDITQPIKTARGYQILKLDTLKTASVQPFESVRDLVADRVSESRQEAEIKKFLTRVRAQALIEWKNADLKKLYDQAIAKADEAKQTEVAFSAAFTAAAIEQQRGRYAVAAERFLKLSTTRPEHRRAVEAHLAGIFNTAQTLATQTLAAQACVA